MKMIGNVSDWLSYAGGALIKVADSAASTVGRQCIGMGKTFKKSFEVKILQEMGSRTKY